ncbi:glycosyltransferase [Conexibacter sp. W3-3-2]|uniref:glycosyltransferase family 4 protein n=1 Tax=Conexibacter sp. W3-3-2 TaxID=2675227 RepID=UPI0012B94DC6|nr:glycosyltransferase family 1 protein [Conexibacter sp. W3-3-2]MTD46191.1 glycosyltransferase [Conexibacter sp. W3-3-2]
MRVAFDTRGAGDPRGIGRYIRCLHEALLATAQDDDVVVETHRPRRVDVFHSPWIDGANVRAGVPQVVTLHDVVPLKRRSEYLRTGMRFRLRYLAVERAQRVICPTAAVAHDVVERLDVPLERISVIGEAPAPAMRPRPADEVAAVRERYGLPDEFLVWVGGMERPDPRKRVAELAATPRELPLVLVGPAREWAHALCDSTDAGAPLILTGHVSDDELAAIYTAAHALVFASDDEGFGLPTVEALACGTPVAACDVPALREVLDGRATLVPVDDLPALVAAAHAAARPAPAPPAWSWEDAARATWAVYREIAEVRPARPPRRPR